MRASLTIVTTCVLLTLFLGCRAPQRLATSDQPAIVIDQLPDYPMPGGDSDFPGGLVAALWHDGRMIRSTTPKAVGKFYIEGVVARQQGEEFFSCLRTAIVRAPEVDAIPLHVAKQSITIRSGSTLRWTRILPDTESVWSDVESRLVGLPLLHSHAVDSGTAERAIGEK